MTRRQIWLGGWGVATDALRGRLAPALPDTEIVVLPPTRANLTAALASPASTALGGWSLGARLLLEASTTGHPGLAGRPRLTLVCPFLAFPSEAGQGGRVSATQVKFLRRRIAKDAPAALADFYERAGITMPAPVALPYSVEELDAGLATLADPTPVLIAHCGARSSPLTLLAGERDPLIDNTRLAELLPGIKILPGAGHDFADFVREIARQD